MSCPRRRQCGGNRTSWSYSWTTDCNGVRTVKTSGNVPAEYLKQQGHKQVAETKKNPSSGNDKIDSSKDTSATDYHEYGLYLHNWYRKRHGSPKMVLVDRLNKAADAYAYKLASQRQLAHTSGLDYNENLYMSSDMSASKKEHVRIACKLWYNEKQHYNFRNGGFSMQTGHFTAMVWKGTTQLGIGCWASNGWVVVVANYKPHANMQGQFGKNVLPYRDVEDSEEEEEKEVVEEKKKDTTKEAVVESPKKDDKKEDKKEDVPEETDEATIPEAAAEEFALKADGDSTIGWSELKEFLNENVQVEFNFDGFDKTICSLLISLITIRTEEKSRVGLEEFGSILKCVGGFLDAYTEFDTDNSGTLDPFELKAALEEAGFNVGYKTYQTLQKLFADDEGEMKFRGYVLCFILLAKLQIVQQKKAARAGGGMFDDFSMKDWMHNEISAISPE